MIQTKNLIIKKDKRLNISKPYEQYFNIYKDTNFIGSINVQSNDRKFEKCEIGYSIHKDYQNKGYATESVQAIITYLFSKNTNIIYASYFENNIASSKVLKKCNFKIIKTNNHVVYTKCIK